MWYTLGWCVTHCLLPVELPPKRRVHCQAFGVGFQRTVKGGNGGRGDGTTTLNYVRVVNCLPHVEQLLGLKH